VSQQRGSLTTADRGEQVGDLWIDSQAHGGCAQPIRHQVAEIDTLKSRSTRREDAATTATLLRRATIETEQAGEFVPTSS
jgi:hypothetical protein